MADKKLHDIDVDEYLHASVNIDPIYLQEEYVRLPADMAYWGARFADAHGRFLRAKLGLERTEARASLQHRVRLENDRTKVTEAMITSEVALDVNVQEAQIELVEAEVERERTRSVVEAVRAKRDMVMGLGATVRAEMQHDPMLREEQANQTRRIQGG